MPTPVAGQHIARQDVVFSMPSTSGGHHDRTSIGSSHRSLDTLNEADDGDSISEISGGTCVSEASISAKIAYTRENEDQDYEALVSLVKKRDFIGLKQLRKKIGKIEGKIAKQKLQRAGDGGNCQTSIKDTRPSLWTDLVQRKTDAQENILMMMLSRKYESRSKDRSGAPKKINQNQSLLTLKVIFKRLSEREKACLILARDPDLEMSVLNELAEHRRWTLVRYLLKNLNTDDRLKAVLDKKHGSNYPQSLYVIASDKEPTMYNILKSLRILPAADTLFNRSLPQNPPCHPIACPKTGYYGTALIINVSFREEGAEHTVRRSSDSDHDKLAAELARLHFSVQSLTERVTHKQLFSSIDGLSFLGSVFILAIQTHGANGILALSDTNVKVDEIISRLHDKIPKHSIKVALLQHCRTDDFADSNAVGGEQRAAFFSKVGLPHDWLIGYSSGYGLTTNRNSYLLQISQTLSSITRNGRYLLDILLEVHANIKKEFPNQIPQLITSFSSDVFLTPYAKKGSLRLQRSVSLEQTHAASTVGTSHRDIGSGPEVSDQQRFHLEQTSIVPNVGVNNLKSGCGSEFDEQEYGKVRSISSDVSEKYGGVHGTASIHTGRHTLDVRDRHQKNHNVTSRGHKLLRIPRLRSKRHHKAESMEEPAD